MPAGCEMEQQSIDAIAARIRIGFEAYRSAFKQITQGAQQRFEMADWQAVQASAKARLGLYDDATQALGHKLRHDFPALTWKSEPWRTIKTTYAQQIAQCHDAELAETFFNSVYCRMYQHPSLNSQHIFIDSSVAGAEGDAVKSPYKTYVVQAGVLTAVREILNTAGFNLPWESLRRDLVLLGRQLKHVSAKESKPGKIEVISAIFYRNKAAYLVGRSVHQGRPRPFVLAILNNEQGQLYLDAVITDPDQVSVIFSFTRAYFMVDVERPAAFVAFLQTLIPMKSKAELYTAIGFYKQGKAEWYRDFSAHIAVSDDVLSWADGTEGMVMSVFTLPSYPVVFKMIKDRFAHSKQITRAGVIAKYQLVKQHDRVGRMADTAEYKNLALPAGLFTPGFLNKLKAVAGQSIIEQRDCVVLKHVWIERRMMPLNLYVDTLLEQGDDAGLADVMNEYGKTIKQLAAANIFAGDMLFKNFGVTRHRRVVFYDYDEIQYLTDCQFREVPEPLYPEQELSAEPWYSVAPNDVFPEEFAMLTACNPKVRKLFNQQHGDLLKVDYWRHVQKEVAMGKVLDVFPYPRTQRLSRKKV